MVLPTRHRQACGVVIAALLISQASLLELLIAPLSRPGAATASACHEGHRACSQHEEREHNTAHEGCDRRCPGEDAGGSCPPRCDDCACCGYLGHLILAERRGARRPLITRRADLWPARYVPTGVSPQVFRPPRTSW
ncbi:MAG: hypothetical protein CSB49_07405 [Proteobacteria bacterium]|nr:MAG: hypothetical protein CSB49_07405 [Pseudomonadota bacterium]